ncbi:F0F1 ATP synthase subunit delta [Clostridium thermopalmarium]|uniref:ATP synthase subunit delta n=1 Tax=Clostridium thermopalmarium DSM 5974 TaxID=1121340 RepID=A0A2T0APA1_9CLOT|nr:F0F1 ATP synthase subunit delta [Clostridium thermopalmarium]MBE6044084.1 F0F1 ATP synthase subunit delta [Clostridium thermopalmarium]PRR70838.1 ATP synthase subunit delta, sodium ion specific [Clostridium thermopalmarium DSM 5974]PVZ28762.1 F-type H+-transporting ATPase subunit delta [Clostridium thermopalmarium DSM 5974]
MYEYLDRRYALALYEIAEKNGKVEEYIKELKEILELIKTNEELLSVVKHPEITTSQKKRVFKSIFKGKVDDYILGFLLILIEKDRILYLEEKINEMEKIHLERQNILVANVKSVIPLNEDEKSTLIGKLKKMYGKNIILKEKIDKSIIGGLYIRVGDDVIDGTIKTKFEEIRRRVIHS